MYHQIVASTVRATFAQISAGAWEPMLDAMAPRFCYRCYGEHALSGERQTLDALRRWWQRSARLFPHPAFEVEEVIVAGGPGTPGSPPASGFTRSCPTARPTTTSSCRT
jgi:ketosteroid isomerase-like protein